MKTLMVMYEGWGERWQLGTLAYAQGQVLFEYSPIALEQKLELSPHRAPLQRTTLSNFRQHMQGLPGFIADSLPDGWGMLLMDRLFRLKGLGPADRTPLDRLAVVSANAMGALTYVPGNPAHLTAGDIQLLELATEAKEVVDDKDTDALMKLALLGGSPHGARPKVLVEFNESSGRMASVPFPGSTPWLVKFQAQNENKEVCALEFVYSQLAQACGLEMPATRWFDLSPSLAAFGIERFDRERGMRVPVLTLAGLLDADFRIPSVDYETFLRATAFLTKDVRETQKAFERAVFNVVFNNRDDHPKNFSFRLGQDRRWKLAPCYDLTFNEGPRGEHQMDFYGKGLAIPRALLYRLAETADLTRKAADSAIDRICGQAAHFSDYCGAIPVLRPMTVAAIKASIDENISNLQ